MARQLGTYFIIMGGISIVFYLFGLMGTNNMVDLFLNPHNITGSTFFTNISAAILGAGLVGGIIVGALTKNFELGLMIIPASFILNFMVNFGQVFGILWNLYPVLAVLFIAPIYIYTFIVVLDWFRGRD